MFRCGVFLSVLAFFSAGVLAQEPAGSVVLSVGKNTAQQSESEVRLLKRKSEIYTQDLILTGDKGRLQLRFSDGSRLAMRENSRLEVEHYHFDAANPDEGESVYRLLKGGLRTLSGHIGKKQPENYQIKTPIATVGIRGTHYALFYCDRSCHEATRSRVGLYGYVLEGAISVSNDDAESVVTAGNFFFLGGNQQSVDVRKTAFELFEIIGDEGVELMNANPTPGIPAFDVRTPLVNPNLDPQSNRYAE